MFQAFSKYFSSPRVIFKAMEKILYGPCSYHQLEVSMKDFTAIIERDGDWYIAYCPEIPGANGQGRTIEECKQSLAAAIALILEDRREEALRGAPADVIRDVVSVA
jgi:predicted RNase H-like HicB family nuclease